MAAKDLSNEQKREWAQILFTKERLSQKEIAAKVGASEKTICIWKEKHMWEQLRKSLLVTKEEQLRKLYNQLDFITNEIEEREYQVANSKEADVISKITSSIKQLETETSIAECFEVGKQFIQFLRKNDLEKAKETTALFDAFIQTQLK